jgi:hypothetical protein
MKAKRITVVFVLAMVVILVSAIPAAARATRIYYTGAECPITQGDPERQWISEDGILHQRGITTHSLVTSDSPYWLGTNDVLWNTEINLATGEVHGYGVVSIHPDAYAGTWEGHFSTHVYSDGTLQGSATVHGTGELEGLKAFNTQSTPAYPDPACFGMNTSDTGYILVP